MNIKVYQTGTIFIGSDRYPIMVTKVSPSGSIIHFQYILIENGVARLDERVLRGRKNKNGEWRDSRHRKHKCPISFETTEYYRDPSF